MSGDIKSIMAKIENMTSEIKYNTAIKNKHEERLATVERKVPDQLDYRLRNLELKTYIITIIVPIVISVVMYFIQRIIIGLI